MEACGVEGLGSLVICGIGGIGWLGWTVPGNHAGTGNRIKLKLQMQPCNSNVCKIIKRTRTYPAIHRIASKPYEFTTKRS